MYITQEFFAARRLFGIALFAQPVAHQLTQGLGIGVRKVLAESIEGFLTFLAFLQQALLPDLRLLSVALPARTARLYQIHALAYRVYVLFLCSEQAANETQLSLPCVAVFDTVEFIERGPDAVIERQLRSLGRGERAQCDTQLADAGGCAFMVRFAWEGPNRILLTVGCHAGKPEKKQRRYCRSWFTPGKARR